jgi:putative thioredoxin
MLPSPILNDDLTQRNSMNEPHKSPWIVETTDDRFEEDVIARSSQVPVVVDFWADWCQPCRMLGPILEQLAADGDGAFELVKANTEQNPVAASTFRVQSIPAVYGVRDGRVVDGFLGAMPQVEIQAWLQRFLPSAAEQLLKEAKRLSVDDPARAELKFDEAMRADPNLSAAAIDFAAFLVDGGRFDEARLIIEHLERRGFLEPDAERVKAAIDIHALGQTAGQAPQLQRQLEEDPSNPQLQLQLAQAYAALEQYPLALDLCLTVVQNNRGEIREQARQTMVDIFRLMPDDSELVGQYRRKLSMALF